MDDSHVMRIFTQSSKNAFLEKLDGLSHAADSIRDFCKNIKEGMIDKHEYA